MRKFLFARRLLMDGAERQPAFQGVTLKPGRGVVFVQERERSMETKRHCC
jgi:hypothetical protein